MRGAGLTRRAALGGVCLCCMPKCSRADAPIALREVAPGIHVRRGADEDASAANQDAIANIGCIVGRDSVLVTDPGGCLADGARLRAAIRQVTGKPISAVLLSHVHPDHIFGAGAFLADGAAIFGHANLPQSLAARGAFYRRQLDDILGPGKAGPVVRPTIAVTGSRTIDLGDRPVTLTAHAPAHTSADMSAFDARTGTLLAADLLFVGRVPSLDGSLKGWLAELDTLAALRPARAVPGHGLVTGAFSAAAAPLTRYLTTLRDETRAAIAAGRGLQAAVGSVARSERAQWKLFDDYHARNVTEAYKELEWE